MQTNSLAKWCEECTWQNKKCIVRFSSNVMWLPMPMWESTIKHSHLKIPPETLHAPRFASYLYVYRFFTQKHAGRTIIQLSAYILSGYLAEVYFYLSRRFVLPCKIIQPLCVYVCESDTNVCLSVCLLFIRIPKSAIVKEKKCNIKESLCDDWNGRNCEVVMETRNI